MPDEKILFVDDEINLLEGIKRKLFEEFEVDIAVGAIEGLKKIENEGPFAVVVSDMQMPGIDGIHFLKDVQKESPQSVRLMLTGNVDLGTAMGAINEGNVFRFITKPVDDEVLKNVLKASLEQHRLIQAEKELLEGTVKGSIEVLMDILSLSNPVAFSRGNRIKKMGLKIAEVLQFENKWLIEISSMLSQIGCVTVPTSVLKKVSLDEQLSTKEQKMISGLPLVGHDLLIKIPRLQTIAEIIGSLETPFTELQGKTFEESDKETVLLVTSMIRLATRLDTLIARKWEREKIISSFEKKERYYHPSVLGVLEKLEFLEETEQVVSVKITELRTGMVLAEDIRAENDALVTTKGQTVTDTMRRLLENYYYQGRIEESVLASVPPQKTSENPDQNPESKG